MDLCRGFEETIAARAMCDPAFVTALLAEVDALRACGENAVAARLMELLPE